MNGIEAVTSAEGLGALQNLQPGIRGAAAGAEAAPFGSVLQTMIDQTSALDEKAASAVTGLLKGEGVEVHEAMIATQKADLAFELALQVRNKVVGAYQQMMQMQF